MENIPAVTHAPTPTSRNDSFVSGSHLKMNANSPANSPAVSTKFSTKFSTSANATVPGIHPVTRLLIPASTAVTTSDTSNKNAAPHTSENEISRSFTRVRMPPFGSRPGTFQMVLSALWRSANTPDAPKNNTRKAITVATIPCDCDALLMTICSTKLAASTPMVSRN